MGQKQSNRELDHLKEVTIPVGRRDYALNGIAQARAKGEFVHTLPFGEAMNKDQARKDAGRMPWHSGPKKDVISCEKPREGAHIL